MNTKYVQLTIMSNDSIGPTVEFYSRVYAFELFHYIKFNQVMTYSHFLSCCHLIVGHVTWLTLFPWCEVHYKTRSKFRLRSRATDFIDIVTWSLTHTAVVCSNIWSTRDFHWYKKSFVTVIQKSDHNRSNGTIFHSWSNFDINCIEPTLTLTPRSRASTLSKCLESCLELLGEKP